MRSRVHMMFALTTLLAATACSIDDAESSSTESAPVDEPAGEIEDLAARVGDDTRIVTADLSASPSSDPIAGSANPGDLLEAGKFEDFLEIPGATPLGWSVGFIESPGSGGLEHTRRDTFGYDMRTEVELAAAADEITDVIESSDTEGLQTVRRSSSGDDLSRSVELRWFLDPELETTNVTTWSVTLYEPIESPDRLLVLVETSRTAAAPVPRLDESLIPAATAHLADSLDDGLERGWAEIGWEFSDDFTSTPGVRVLEGTVEFDLGEGEEADLAPFVADLATSLGDVDFSIEDITNYYSYRVGDVRYTLDSKFRFGRLSAEITVKALTS